MGEFLILIITKHPLLSNEKLYPGKMVNRILVRFDADGSAIWQILEYPQMTG